MVPYDWPIFLVGDEGTDIEDARRSLIRVGLDDIHGYLKNGMRTWIEAGFEQEHIQQASVKELSARLPERPFVLDVRGQGEWSSGHIEGALHIPGGELPKRLNEVPNDTPVHVICGSGYRSSIATSVLERGGIKSIINIVGGMGAWNAQNLPTEAEAASCPLGG